MAVVALDTSSAVVSVAVHDGRVVRARRALPPGRRHAELLMPALTGALAEAGLDWAEVEAIGVGVGPGPFTGLRVGLVTARVLGHVLEIPVLGVCSLDVVAAAAVAGDGLEVSGFPEASEFLVALDALRREVHWARYRVVGDRAVRVSGPAVDRPADVPRDGLPVVGRGSALYPEPLGPACGPWEPDAARLAVLVVEARRRGERLLPPEPLYLRRPDAVEPAAAKSVLTGS